MSQTATRLHQKQVTNEIRDAIKDVMLKYGLCVHCADYGNDHTVYRIAKKSPKQHQFRISMEQIFHDL